jgi:ABC-type glutathione transport system ATPase component
MEKEVTLTPNILEVDNLSLKSLTGKTLVDGVSFDVGNNECMGLVGESGSGKTLTLRSVIGLLPQGVVKTGGEIRRGGKMSMIFQDPVRSLDPLYPVVSQLAEVVAFRQGLGRRDARDEAVRLLEALGLPDTLEKTDRYPHQLSGGQCQRVVIAMALACKPDILLCDEPTTALDVTVQKQILDVIKRLREERGFAIVFVTHNLAIASAMCSKLCVMKQGRIIERGDTAAILSAPKEEYTKTLIRSVLPLPEMEGGRAG